MEEDFSKYNGEGTTLRKAQLRMLDILIEFDKICKKHNISYWIDFGTLLGAVRHGGFIPWDDDIDVSVLWDDYKKLRKILPAELQECFFFQDWKTEKKMVYKLGKVSDKKSYYEGKSFHQIPGGVYIDIFPMHNRLSFKLKSILDYAYGRCYRRIRGFNNCKTQKIIAYIGWIPLFTIASLAELTSKLFKTDKVGQLYGSITLDLKLHRQKSSIFPLNTITFEGYTFSCPKNPDSYLRDLYGDYMQIPPEDKREVHALKIEFLEE